MAGDGQSKAALKRTVSFFRLVVEDGSGNILRLPDKPWENMLSNLVGMKVTGRTYDGPTRKLIGQALLMDGGGYAFKLMEPRDENSWLELVKADNDAEAFDSSTIGTLVETTIIVFLPKKNIFGMIRGSTSSPSHTAVAEWIDHWEPNGKRLLTKKDQVIKAEPALSKRQKERLDAASGVSMASVRISTDKAQELSDVGSAVLGESLRQLKEVYGDIFVTITLRVPRGKKYDAARAELKKEAQRLNKVVGDAEAVTATLVHYDAEQKAHLEDVDFMSQRITTSKSVPLLGEDGTPIRNESAVRAILAAAAELRRELDSV